jgi:hypothetical protein
MVKIRALVRWARESPNPTVAEVNRAWAAARSAAKEAFRMETELRNQEERKAEVENLKKAVRERILFLTAKTRWGRQLREQMPDAPVDASTSPNPK